MFIRKMQMPQQGMPTAEEFALWGARELSFEELLEVNGGKREKKEKKSSGKSTSSGSSGSSSSGGSSGSSRSRRSSGTGSSSKDSSKSKEKKNKKSKAQTGSSAFDEKKSKPGTQNGTSSGNNLQSAERRDKEEKQNGSTDYTVQKGDTLSGIIRQRYPGASKEEIVRRVKEAASHSGITDIDKIEPGQKIVFEKPAPPSERPNEGEKIPPTQGGGSPRGRWGRSSDSGGASGSTGGSSGNSSGGESSGRGSSSGGNADSGGSARFNGRRNGGADWQEGKNPRMPPGWGTKEKQYTEGQSDGQEGGADFAAPQEKKGFLAGLKERFSRGSRDGAVLMTANTDRNTGTTSEANNTACNGIQYQTAANNDFHCDIIAWNSALDNNMDPRGQNDETWDGNGLNVNQIFNHYPNNRSNTPVANTKGYIFYDWRTDGIFDHMEYYEAGSGTDYTVWQTDGINNPVPRIYDSSRDSNGSGGSAATAIFVPLNRNN